MADTEIKENKGPVEVSYFVCCEHAFRDHKGRPCLIGIFDDVTFKQLPVTMIVFYIVLEVRNIVAGTVSFKIMSPSGVEFPGRPFIVPDSVGAAIFEVAVGSYVFAEEGRYNIEALLDNERFALTTIDVDVDPVKGEE